MKQTIKLKQMAIAKYSKPASPFLFPASPVILLLTAFLFFATAKASAQGSEPRPFANLPATILNAEGHIPDDDMVKYNLSGVEIPVDHVTGNPFNSDSFQLALLQGMRLDDKWLCPAKIHEVSGEVYFQNSKGEVRSLDKGFIQKIIFYKGSDTSAKEKTYISEGSLLIENNQYGNPFMEVMNNGKYALLKRTIKDVRSADSMFGTQKRFYYSSTVKYYLLSGQKIEPLKRLTKESITFNLPGASQADKWIAEHKINFKKENDIILFLNYYNSLTP